MTCFQTVRHLSLSSFASLALALTSAGQLNPDGSDPDAPYDANAYACAHNAHVTYGRGWTRVQQGNLTRMVTFEEMLNAGVRTFMLDNPDPPG